MDKSTELVLSAILDKLDVLTTKVDELEETISDMQRTGLTNKTERIIQERVVDTGCHTGTRYNGYGHCF